MSEATDQPKQQAKRKKEKNIRDMGKNMFIYVYIQKQDRGDRGIDETDRVKT